MAGCNVAAPHEVILGGARKSHKIIRLSATGSAGFWAAALIFIIWRIFSRGIKRRAPLKTPPRTQPHRVGGPRGTDGRIMRAFR